MVGANYDRSRSWVEDIYWSHFQFHHFAQFLRTGYDQHLALPRTFSENVKKKLPENVGLRGPGGIVWNIGLTTREDTLHFRHGWQQFVKDHQLKENDFLVFKYNGESMFDVLIFDGGSFCEKPASYFVRKCGLIENGALSNEKDEHISFDEHNTPSNAGGEALSKGKGTKTSLEEDNVPSNASVEFVTPEKSVHGNGTINVPLAVPVGTPSEWTPNAGNESAPPEQIVDANADLIAVPSEQFVDGNANVIIVPPSDLPSPSASNRVRKLVSAVNRVQTKRRARPVRVVKAKQEGIDWVTDAGPASVGRSVSRKSGGRSAHEFYTSNRRHVTEHEISNAYQMAQAACTNGSFSVVMRPTHVYKRFYVSLPNKWIQEHLSPQSQDVILRMVEHEWLARYSFDTIRRNGGLTGGWKYFSLDNNLEEFDVCVFKPAGRTNNILIMDVSIFRVVEQTTPLSAAKSPRTWGGRKKALRAMQV